MSCPTCGNASVQDADHCPACTTWQYGAHVGLVAAIAAVAAPAGTAIASRLNAETGKS